MKKYSAYASVLILVVAGLLILFNQKITETKNQLEEETKAKQLLDQRVAEILAERDDLEQEKDSLLEKIDEFMTEEEVRLDSATVEENIKQVGELATVSYCYTNAGTIDAQKNLFNTKIKLPGGSKTAVVTMDGVIKAGIDVGELSLSVDEDNKMIIVTVPQPRILSHEINENSMQVYNETSGIFNSITLDDSRDIRIEIKTKAEEKALSKDIDILSQAEKNAQLVIKNFLTTDPTIRENYKIEFNMVSKK